MSRIDLPSRRFASVSSSQTRRWRRPVRWALALTSASLPSAFAADTWDNQSGDLNWSSPNNWASDTEPDITDAVTFPTPIPGDSNIVMGSTPSEAALSLAFNDSYTLGSGAITLGAGGNVNVASGKTVVINTAISGTGLTKSGAGALNLGAGNSFTGNIAINGGALRVNADNQLGNVANNIALNGGTIAATASFNSARNLSFSSGSISNFDVAAASTVTLSGVISGGGGFANLRKTGGGTLVLSGNSTFNASSWLTVTAGTVRLAASNVLPASVWVDGGTGTIDMAGFNQTVASVGASAIINSSGTPSTLTIISPDSSIATGSISGSITLNHNGTGLLELASPNTYTGDTNINGGFVFISTTNGVPTASRVTIAAFATLYLNSYNQTIGSLAGTGNVYLTTSALTTGGDNSSSSYAGIISGTNPCSLVKNGTGTLTLSGLNTYSGSTVVHGGTLLLQSSLTTNLSVSVDGGATIALASGTATRVLKAPVISVTGAARIDLADNKLITAVPIGSWNGANYTNLTALVASGRGDGTWNAPGITTSMSDAVSGSGYTALGIASAAEVRGIGPTDTDIWGGHTVTGSDTLVMYTYGGDANLSGNVDVDDYGQIDFNANVGGILGGWYNGDFDYNGVQDVDDYGVIDFVVNIQGTPFPTASSLDGSPATALVSSVPEPTTAVLLTGFLSLIRRRRRRSPLGPTARTVSHPMILFT